MLDWVCKEMRGHSIVPSRNCSSAPRGTPAALDALIGSFVLGAIGPSISSRPELLER